MDDDFDRLQGRTLPSPNLLATDAHDLECMLLRSPALDGVLAEYGDRDKIRCFEATHGGTVRNALLARGLVFGRLRWLALRRGWSLPFEKLGPERFADRQTWEVDRDGLYAAAVTVGVPGGIDAVHAAVSALPDADAPRRRRFPLTARLGLGPVNRHIQSGGGQVARANPATTSGPADSGRDWSNVAAALQNSGVSFHHREQSGIHKEPLKSYRRIATGRSRQPGHHSGWDAGIRTSGMARTVGRGKAQRIPPPCSAWLKCQQNRSSNPGYLRIKRLRTIECRVTARSKVVVSFTIERRA